MISKLNIIRSLLPSIYFNFKYLPIKQAVKLPILVYKPRFIKMAGNLKIEASKIKFGMIRMGFFNTLQYPDSGVVWENLGGMVKFYGKACIGNSSSISIGPNATLEFGAKFENNAALKLICYNSIKIGKSCSFGWDCIIMDTNFHALYDTHTHRPYPMGGGISIGNFNWFGSRCAVLSGTVTNDNVIFALGSIVTKSLSTKSYNLYAPNTELVSKKVNVYRDFNI